MGAEPSLSPNTVECFLAEYMNFCIIGRNRSCRFLRIFAYTGYKAELKFGPARTRNGRKAK